MKYFLFGTAGYFECGGMDDFIANYNSPEEAEKALIGGVRTRDGYLIDYAHLATINEEGDLVLIAEYHFQEHYDPPAYFRWIEKSDKPPYVKRVLATMSNVRREIVWSALE